MAHLRPYRFYWQHVNKPRPPSASGIVQSGCDRFTSRVISCCSADTRTDPAFCVLAAVIRESVTTAMQAWDAPDRDSQELDLELQVSLHCTSELHVAKQTSYLPIKPLVTCRKLLLSLSSKLACSRTTQKHQKSLQLQTIGKPALMTSIPH